MKRIDRVAAESTSLPPHLRNLLPLGEDHLPDGVSEVYRDDKWQIFRVRGDDQSPAWRVRRDMIASFFRGFAGSWAKKGVLLVFRDGIRFGFFSPIDGGVFTIIKGMVSYYLDFPEWSAPFRRYYSGLLDILIGLVPAMEVDWRPNEMLPEDFYSL